MAQDQEYEQTVALLREKNIEAEEHKDSKWASFLIDVTAFIVMTATAYVMATAHIWLKFNSWHDVYENLRWAL